MKNISEAELQILYERQKMSVAQIAKQFCCSQNRINYWLNKYGIKKRSISDAVYAKRNPKGDPFTQNPISSKGTAFLFGIGLGLYWGEGTKSNKNSVRLGNTNPALIKKFLEFLYLIYGIRKEKLRFGLQVFSDMNPIEAKIFWQKTLNIKQDQFQKVITTPSRGVGNYRNKTKYGVLTVYFHNKKLRDIICTELEKL